MARIRTVKPELRTDLTVASWPITARYAWVLLWGYLDDHGRGIDDPRLLCADLFPLDDNITARKVTEFVDLWVKDGQVCRYEVDGRAYMHAVNWGKHQRTSHPLDSRVPCCLQHSSGTETEK